MPCIWVLGPLGYFVHGQRKRHKLMDHMYMDALAQRVQTPFQELGLKD